MTDSPSNDVHIPPSIAASRSRKWRTYSMCNEVVIYLRDAGFGLAHRRTEERGLSEAVRVARDKGDILGLPSWTIAVRCQQNLDMSAAATEVAQEAARAGRDMYVSIQPRKGHPLDEAYATMPLHVFVKVLQKLHPTAVLPRQVDPDLASALVAKGGEPS